MHSINQQIREWLSTLAQDKKNIVRILLLITELDGELANLIRRGKYEEYLKKLRSTLTRILSLPDAEKILKWIQEIREETKNNTVEVDITPEIAPSVRIGLNNEKIQFALSFKLRLRNVPDEVRKIIERGLRLPYNLLKGLTIEKTVLSLYYVEGDTYYIPAYLVDELLGILHLLGFNGADESREKIVRYYQSHVDSIYIPSYAHIWKIKIRDYQEQALRKLVENGLRGIIVLPVGAGKTIIALELLADLKKQFIVLVDKDALRRQWRHFVYNYLGVHVVSNIEEGSDVKAPGIVTTVQQLGKLLFKVYAEPGSISMDFLESIFMRPIVVIDEVHHICAPEHLAVLLSFNPYALIGITATPSREDVNEVYIYPLLGGVVYSANYFELCREGYLAPVLLYRVAQPINKLYQVAVTILHEAYKKAKTVEERELVADLLKLLEHEYERLPSLLQSYFIAKGEKNFPLLRRLYEDIRHILELIYGIASLDLVIREAKAGRKTLIFVDRKMIADTLTDIAQMLGIQTAEITGERKDLSLLHDKNTKLIVATQAGEEGVDIPDLDNIIFVAIPESKRAIIQRLGRVSRPREGKIAHVYVIYASDLGAEREKGEELIEVMKRYLNYEEMLDWIQSKVAERENFVPNVRNPESYLKLAKIMKVRIPWLEDWLRKVMNEEVENLTQLESLLLWTLRMILEYMQRGQPTSTGTMIGMQHLTRKRMGTVKDWILNPEKYGLPHSPDRTLFRKLKDIYKESGPEATIQYLVNLYSHQFPTLIQKIFA